MPGMYVEPLPILTYGKEPKGPFVLRDAPLDISEGGGGGRENCFSPQKSEEFFC